MDLDFRGIVDLVSKLIVPAVGWLAWEVRGVRLNITWIEEWVKGHDERDDERFKGRDERLDRHDRRLEAVEKRLR